MECPLRPRCFSLKSTRRVIRRLPIDAAKDALREVMAHPKARQKYARRKAMVEPVFSFLSGVMNLRRFRRWGPMKVRLEFNLHVAAYNLGRVLAALPAPLHQIALSCLQVCRAALYAHRAHHHGASLMSEALQGA